MSKLENLLEQTSFLLDRQLDAKNEGGKLFVELLSLIENKLKQTRDEEDRECLENIYDAMSGEAQKFSEDATDDIEFLKDQMQALKAIKEVPDKEKARELLSALIDEEEEIQETAAFKKDVLDEAQISRQNLMSIINDFKAALEEGNIKELEAMISSMVGEDEEEDFEDDEDLDEDEEECDDCCGHSHKKEEAKKKNDGCCGCKSGCDKGCK